MKKAVFIYIGLNKFSYLSEKRWFSITYVRDQRNHVISVETYMNEVTIFLYLDLLKLMIFV